MSGISLIHSVIHARCSLAFLASGSSSSSCATFTARARSSEVEGPRVCARPGRGAKVPENRIAIAMLRPALAFIGGSLRNPGLPFGTHENQNHTDLPVRQAG